MDSFCDSKAARAVEEEGQRAKLVFVGCTSLRREPFEPSSALRLEKIAYACMSLAT
jgi:hypothetical protein